MTRAHVIEHAAAAVRQLQVIATTSSGAHQRANVVPGGAGSTAVALRDDATCSSDAP
jgi:hypothetical protein